jgi:hypothetical protein
LVKNSPIILADEPTGSLDDVTGTKIMELLKEIAKERLVILVTHNQEYVEKYADRIIRLEAGKVIEDVVITQRKEAFLNCEYENGKNDLSAVKKFFLTNLKSSKLKTFYTVLLFSVFILISFLFLSFVFINADNAYIKVIRDDDYVYVDVLNQDLKKIGYVNYENLDDKLKSHSLPYISTSHRLLTKSGKSIIKSDYFISKTFIVDDNFSYHIRDKEILLTDYLASLILNDNPDLNTEEDIIGMEILIDRHAFEVSGIVDTGYKTSRNWYNLDNYYSTIFMHQMSIDYFHSIKDSYESVAINNKKYHFVYLTTDDALLENEVLISRDLLAAITEHSVTMSFDDIEDVPPFNMIITGEIPDDNITRTIRFSNEFMNKLSYLDKRLFFYNVNVCSMDGKCYAHPAVFPDNYHVFLPDPSLTGNQAKMSSDLSLSYPIEKLKLIIPYQQWMDDSYKTELDILEVVADYDQRNAFYVSEEMYQQLFAYHMYGGAIMKMDDESIKLIPKFHKKHIYFYTNEIYKFDELIGIMEIAYIALLILSLATFLILIVLFNSFLNQRMEIRKRDYILLKCLGNNSTIKKIIFCETAFVMTLSFIIAIVFFLLITNPVNRLLGNVFFKQVGIALFTPIIVNMALAVLTSAYVEISFMKRFRRIRELDILK